MKRTARMLALFTAAALIFMLLPITELSALAATYTIADADDWARLVKRCRVDTASVGMNVVLIADLDLGDADDPVIPTFGGTFDGGGHTISGIDIQDAGSNVGLFRYIQETGVVKNLNVRGSVTPTGTRQNVGGVAGVNYGALNTCTFVGIVKGKDRVGGLVGYNAADALIQSCTMTGSVTGEHSTGGIAGENYGNLLNCKNLASVNTTDVAITIDYQDFDLTQLNSTENTTVRTDTGGVAGVSKGTIQYCRNQGTVGYPHAGYNVGGIAGRQSGYMNGCINTGAVYGRKDVGGVAGQLEPYMTLSFSEDLLQQVQREMDELVKYIKAASSSMSEMGVSVSAHMSSISGELERASDDIEILITGAVDYYNEFSTEMNRWLDDMSYQPNFPHLSGSYDSAARDLADALSNIAEDSAALSADISSGSRSVNSSVRAAANKLNDISVLITGYESALTDEDEEIPAEDVSDQDTVSSLTGKIYACTNRGTVEGDVNAGGVAGSMAIEYDFDPEDDVTVRGEKSLNYVYESKAVIRASVNEGTVRSKRDYAGGVVGLQDMGSVMESEAYGSVESTDGNYVGGIAGASYAIIRGSYAMCTLAGGNNIGGIAGYATELYSCCALVRVERGAACVGAIAGESDPEGTLESNRFVGDALAGVDGITYTGRAEAVSYDALLRVSGLPEEFKSFYVSFVADGEEVARIPFAYGEAFDEALLPAVPEKAGYFGEWEAFDAEQLAFTTIVHATYRPYDSVLGIASGTEADALPHILVEGSFGEGAALTLTRESTDIPAVSGRGLTVLEAWRLLIPESTETDGAERYTVRLRMPDEHNQLSVWQNVQGVWKKLSTVEDGSYLVFSVSGRDVKLCLAQSPLDWLFFVFLMLLAADVAAICIVAGRRLVQRRRLSIVERRR